MDLRNPLLKKAHQVVLFKVGVPEGYPRMSYTGYYTKDVIVGKIAVPSSSHARHGKSRGGKLLDI